MIYDLFLFGICLGALIGIACIAIYLSKDKPDRLWFRDWGDGN